MVQFSPCVIYCMCSVLFEVLQEIEALKHSVLKAAVFIAVIDLEVLIGNTRKLSYLALASEIKKKGVKKN